MKPQNIRAKSSLKILKAGRSKRRNLLKTKGIRDASDYQSQKVMVHTFETE
jgi:hypothetical protein